MNRSPHQSRDHEPAGAGVLPSTPSVTMPGPLNRLVQTTLPITPALGAFIGPKNRILRVNSRVSAKIILVLGPNFGNPQSHGSKTPNRLRKFRNGTCNSNNLEQKYGNTGLSTLHFRTLQIFTITQTRKID